MTVLMWDKPSKKLSKAQWKEISFEDGPDGGYVPNMSDADKLRWKAKLVGVKKKQPQVEIRRQCGPSLMLIIVNMGTGYNYKQYSADTEYDGYQCAAEYDAEMVRQCPSMADYYESNPTTEEQLQQYRSQASTRGINIHISANGPLQMTFEDLADMNAAIEEAKEFLRNLEP